MRQFTKDQLVSELHCRRSAQLVSHLREVTTHNTRWEDLEWSIKEMLELRQEITAAPLRSQKADYEVLKALSEKTAEYGGIAADFVKILSPHCRRVELSIASPALKHECKIFQIARRKLEEKRDLEQQLQSLLKELEGKLGGTGGKL
jgi:hypothetical protein